MHPERRTVLELCAALSVFCTLAPACGEDVPRPTGPSSVGPIELPAGQTVGGPSRPLDKADGPRFSGVAMTQVGASCSGSLVVPSAVDLTADGPAYVLTAGHCALGIGHKPNDVLLDQPVAWPSDQVVFRIFGDSTDAAVDAHPRSVVFASMKGADLALVEMENTRFQLRSMGVVPFVLTDEPTRDGEEIAFAGHPNGVPAVLSACRFERRVPFLIEAPFHFFDVESNHCLDSVHGASGSPVFSLATGKVVAVVSTTAEPPSSAPCQLNSPCEAEPPGSRFELGTNYTVPVVGLSGCFDAAGRFDIDAAACPLDRGDQMQPAEPFYNQPAVSVGSAAFGLALDTQGLTHYRTLVAPLGSDDCRDVARYGPVVSAADSPTIHATVPGEPGLNLICIQAGVGSDPATGGWQDPSRPTLVIATVY